MIPADEPVFLIRGKDEVGAAAVRAWAHLHRVNGGQDAIYLDAMRQADKMENWLVHEKADLPEKIANAALGIKPDLE